MLRSKLQNGSRKISVRIKFKSVETNFKYHAKPCKSVHKTILVS